jgi:preprotein translocase subunit YajC
MSLIYALIIVAFYYFLIRPQRKREKETQQMRKSLNEGDEIITIGGIYGKVVNIKEDLITVEVNADKAKIKIARWAVGKVVEKEKV